MKALFSLLFLSLGMNCSDQMENQDTIKILYIENHLVDCTGVGPQKCMLVKENPNDDYIYFYDNIVGFDYEEGHTYKIKVSTEKIKNPPADGSSLKYTLVEILEKEKK